MWRRTNTVIPKKLLRIRTVLSVHFPSNTQDTQYPIAYEIKVLSYYNFEWGGGNKEGAQFFTACTEVESYFQQLLHSKSLDNILK